ncbi:MAG: hypothetical protein U5L95_01045 [Candidatus Saccharibacteria bacterium]|nr:hypothetical protein [Candidatus Saccharibacteria bacterium]
MIVLGMTGPISHGKTTFAEALEELEPKTIHLESSIVIARVANAMHAVLERVPDPYDIQDLNEWLKHLPRILKETVHTDATFEQLRLDQASIEQHPVEYQKLIIHVEQLRKDPGLARQAITIDNKETYRPFLQWLGGYLVQKVDSDIWFNEIVRMMYEAESTGVKLCIIGGLRFPNDAAAIRHAGGQIVKVYRPGHLQNDMLDPTERERDNIPVDCTIMSNGTVEDVKVCAKHVLEDIRNNRLSSLYQTKRENT